MHASHLNSIVDREIRRIRSGSRSFEYARAASGGTPAQQSGSAFGQWGGWSGSVGLADLLAGASQPRFNRRGANLYRISFPGGGVAIGMTVSNSIMVRVHEHAQSPRGEARIQARINAVPLEQHNTIRIQAGLLRAAMSIREVHMYEIWLQSRENVFDWSFIRNTRTFE
ncbi:MAG: hypothetical protein Q8L53_16210 [Aestuariivirga sp.]|nr:hypothetical protein [Aestuariivirga sp.]